MSIHYRPNCVILNETKDFKFRFFVADAQNDDGFEHINTTFGQRYKNEALY